MSSKANDHKTRVLVVEDNPVDVRLLLYALGQESTWSVETVIAEDGEKAIALLSKPYARPFDASHPDFIILDLNLPRRDGTEVLQVIRTTEHLRTVPVAILSSSPDDIIRHKLHEADVFADGHFTKPMDVEDFLQLGKALRNCYERSRPR